MLEVCPTCTDTSAQTAASLADRGIDRLVELRPLVDETRFEFIDVSNFGAINLLLQNTPDALPKIRVVPKCPAPSNELRSPV